MPYLRTRLQVAARLRRDGQFSASLPLTADVNADLNETVAWWWSILCKRESSGIGNLETTVVATAGQDFIAIPATMRQVHQLYRPGFDYPAVRFSRNAYGRPLVNVLAPGVWWPEYRAADGQVIEIRPVPTTAETITLLGTSAPPQWTDDVGTVDLIDEHHERAIIDVTRARINFRDDQAALAQALQAAENSLPGALSYEVPQTPTPWTMWQR